MFTIDNTVALFQWIYKEKDFWKQNMTIKAGLYNIPAAYLIPTQFPCVIIKGKKA